MSCARVLVVALSATLAACGTGVAQTAGKSVSAVAAFYPLEFVVASVGGQRVSVESLTPSGVEPHDLEISARQVADLADADLIVYLGQGFQPAVEDVLAELDGPVEFDSLQGVELLGGDEGAGGIDPHVWLDPTRMAQMVDGVARQLSDLDRRGASVYESNAEAIKQELAKLDRDYARALRSCRSREIVTSHGAFGYLAARYGLEQVSVTGTDPEAEPSAGRLADVVDYVREHNINTIFFEELAPEDIAETLAAETGATTEVLSPLESKPEHGDYFDAMRGNLDRLREALDCE